MIDRLLKIIEKLRNEKFTGEIILNFNQGGIRGIKKAKYENI